MSEQRKQASFDEADAELADVLAELEGADNYTAWIMEFVGPWVMGDVVEIGAGRGTFSEQLRSLGTSLTAVEPSVSLADHLSQRLAGIDGAVAICGTLDDVGAERFDTAVMLNVLEHIDDDAAMLRSIAARLSPGGRLCVWVPAFPSLYGEFDRRIGHHRRYRRRPLVALMEASGFTVAEVRHTNLIGFFGWWAVVRVLGRFPTAGRLSQVYDRWLLPVTQWVERRVPPPFGQSIFIVGEVPQQR